MPEERKPQLRCGRNLQSPMAMTVSRHVTQVYLEVKYRRFRVICSPNVRWVLICWRWKRNVPPKCWYPCALVHGVTDPSSYPEVSLQEPVTVVAGRWGGQANCCSHREKPWMTWGVASVARHTAKSGRIEETKWWERETEKYERWSYPIALYGGVWRSGNIGRFHPFIGHEGP